ncbi:hypothetical protein JM83_2678 [Gillisia sp. Hel_I_86]|uniref:hypothetical protein n=1 Tax=Gillisia sp. Hel_I_86 TaxID=1249981 RepID=UPI00119BE4FD|nr:hypothetical protein [Gillisia sp. Hel_I_86]TVZ27628.1 hypothetical protein JM83_2678 [Gillisia sp. Hel_I_86]
MIDKFTFLNNSWSWPILLGAVVLLVVFVWKESPQKFTFRFYIKIFVALLAVFSLAMIALQPAVINTGHSGGLIILTEGFRKTSLDSLKKENKNIKVLKDAPDIPIIKELVGIDSVYILGHGIKPYDLWQLEGKATKYVEGIPLTGITKFNYHQAHSVGDKLVIKGLYKSPDQNIQLVLEGPGGQNLDSLHLKNNPEQAFTLETELKAAGKFIYTLVEKDSVGTIKSSNPIPIKVNEKEALKVLMINGFPTFETKYLKNFLAEMDHEVIVRSQVTKGRFKYEHFNTGTSSIGNISEKLLESYDLLIMDFNSFRALSPSEKKSLERSIRENGLGVFIQPDAALFRSNSGLVSFDVTQENSETATVQENVNLTKYPFSFQKSLSLQPIENSGGKILSAYKRIGQGKLGSSVLENTYELLLDGHSLVYQRLWTKHINTLSKRTIPLAEWSSDSKTGIPDEPFQFSIRTLEPEPRVLNNEGAVIPLAQDIDIPSLWTGTTYPKITGWQQLKMQQDTAQVFDYYVAPVQEWKILRANEAIQANKRYAGKSDSPESKILDPNPINPIYFYLLFLFSMGYLWLVPKMGSQ